jgi:hypothetical protein
MILTQKKFCYHCTSVTQPDCVRGHIECQPERQSMAGEAYRSVVLVFDHLVSPLLNQNRFLLFPNK